MCFVYFEKDGGGEGQKRVEWGFQAGPAMSVKSPTGDRSHELELKPSIRGLIN